MEFQLRKWKKEDIEDVARFADNKKIASNLRDGFPHPYALDDAREYVDSCIQNTEERQICRAIVVDGHAVGSIGIFLCNDVYQKSGELGYWLAEEYWGQGIMSAAVRAICKKAFNRFDIVRIFAEPYAHNAGSRRVLEKAGFTLEGTMRQGVFKDGKLCDYCIYALLKEDFRA